MAERTSTLREGLILGLIGYVSVAVFYALFDLLAARSTTFTLNLLGLVVFRGVRDPAVLQLPVAPDTAAMIAYNLLHFVLALAVGLFVAGLVRKVEDRPEIGPAVLLVLIGGYLLTIVVVGMALRFAAPLLPAWTILVVNTLAAGAGAIYLLRAHPGLVRRVRGAAAGS